MNKYTLWLLKLFGYANPKLSTLMRRYEMPKEIYNAIINGEADCEDGFKETVSSVSLEEAEQLQTELKEKGIHIISYDNELYPKELMQLDNPPVALFIKGNASLLDTRLVSISGSRNISEYTVKTETAVCKELCNKYTLVSSLGEGCEKCACLTAIEMNKGCIEIMPCGFDTEYPAGSNIIREKLIESGGCIVSEYLPQKKNSLGGFMQKSRIAGSIAKAMIIFQAGPGSGSLNAAGHSGALFFLPPNDIFDKRYAGAVIAARKGAYLYYDINDIDAVFKTDYTPKNIRIRPLRNKNTDEKKKNNKPEKKIKEKAETVPPKKAEKPSEERFETPLHYKVFLCIARCEQITFDEIYRNTEADLSELNEILLDLEIDGMIEALPGSRYKKA